MCFSELSSRAKLFSLFERCASGGDAPRSLPGVPAKSSGRKGEAVSLSGDIIGDSFDSPIKMFAIRPSYHQNLEQTVLERQI